MYICVNATFSQCTILPIYKLLFKQSSLCQHMLTFGLCMNYKTVKIQLKHSIIMQNFVCLMLCNTHLFNVMLRVVTLITIMLVIITLSAAFLILWSVSLCWMQFFYCYSEINYADCHYWWVSLCWVSWRHVLKSPWMLSNVNNVPKFILPSIPCSMNGERTVRPFSIGNVWTEWAAAIAFERTLGGCLVFHLVVVSRLFTFIAAWGNWYKTFYGRNLRMGQTSYGGCPA